MSKEEILDLNKIVDSFVETVIPKDASDTQKNETKKAFICGMIFGFRLPTDMVNMNNEEVAMNQLTNYNIQLKNMEKELSMGDENEA